MEPRPPSPTGVIPQSVSIAGFAKRTIQQTALGCIRRYTHAELSPRGGYLCVVGSSEARWHGVAMGGVRVCREDVRVETFVPVVFGSPSPNTRVYSSVSTVALRGVGRSSLCCVTLPAQAHWDFDGAGLRCSAR